MKRRFYYGNFPLKNDGQLEIFFIGVGAAAAEKHNQTNFLIVKGDTHILVDLGSTGQRALRETAGLGLSDIEVILPTHSHADHVGGIENLALNNRYVGRRFQQKPKLKMIIGEEYQRMIWDYTLRGGLEYNEENDAGQKLYLVDYFDIVRPKWKTHQPRETFEVDYGGIHLEIFRTKHIPDTSSNWETSFLSYGLFVDDRIFLSGDTRFDQELIEMYAHAEYFFHDVQFFPDAVHAPLADLRTLPSEIKARMGLIHYADNFYQQDISGFAGWAGQGVGYLF